MFSGYANCGFLPNLERENKCAICTNCAQKSPHVRTLPNMIFIVFQSWYQRTVCPTDMLQSAEKLPSWYRRTVYPTDMLQPAEKLPLHCVSIPSFLLVKWPQVAWSCTLDQFCCFIPKCILANQISVCQVSQGVNTLSSFKWYSATIPHPLVRKHDEWNETNEIIKHCNRIL